MCIYYTKKRSLHYTGQDHIFPAGIGGIRKLPKGYVSDEFNNDISKLEQSFLRESLISAARQLEGPGKRGSFSEQHATKSNIHLIVNVRDRQITGLGYIKLGRTIEIPQVKINTATGELAISFDKSSATHLEDSINEFRSQCNSAYDLRVKMIVDDRLDSNIIFFGIENEIEENFNAFFAKHSSNKMDVTADKIQAIGNSLKNVGKDSVSQKYLPSSHHTVKFDIEYFRIYGKIAFNFLAELKGTDLIMKPEFDSIRNWIAAGGDNKYAHLDNGPGIFKDLPIINSESVHYVILMKAEHSLYAHLSFYGAMKAIVVLDKDYKEPFATNGLICDWKGHQEYDFLEYIGKIEQ
ncbi:MAG TPA: hypothetical protein VK796_04150 [Cytophaga sp.]|jgi:hypothetical protein|nr:hypothetical protein [Cytophaga sp.]